MAQDKPAAQAGGADAHREPEMVADYRLVRQFAGGSMAEVFLAHKMSPYGFVRPAVIKRVRRARPDYHELQPMLLDEARAAAAMTHPNVVQLLDVGEFDGGVFLALEYVEGTDLRKVSQRLRTRSEALPFELAAFVLCEVLRGLHHAHQAKDDAGRSLELVHRDVTPSNVLIARTGHVKLSDFGVVAMAQRFQQATAPGLIKGKYAYLAPEYIAGESASVRTDLYSAGVMLFELLTGREGFPGDSAYEVMWRIVNQGVPHGLLADEGVPESLRAVVARATDLVPERRYPTALAFADALEWWLVQSGLHASPAVLALFLEQHNLVEVHAPDVAAARPRTESRIVKPRDPTPVPEDALAAMPEIVIEAPSEGPMDVTLEQTVPVMRTGDLAPSPQAIAESDASEEDGGPSIPPEMPAPWQGSLERWPAADVLSHLHEGGATGQLEFRCGLIWKRVRFEDGDATQVRSNMGMELIGEHLVKHRLIERSELDDALRRAEQAAEPLTQVLLSNGRLARPVLETALAENLSQRLEEVFDWRWGSFSFQPSEEAPSEIRPSLNLGAFIEAQRARRAQDKKPVPRSDSDGAEAELRRAFALAQDMARSSGKGRVDRLAPPPARPPSKRKG